jgi:hypothetical protein
MAAAQQQGYNMSKLHNLFGHIDEHRGNVAPESLQFLILNETRWVTWQRANAITTHALHIVHAITTPLIVSNDSLTTLNLQDNIHIQKRSVMTPFGNL